MPSRAAGCSILPQGHPSEISHMMLFLGSGRAVWICLRVVPYGKSRTKYPSQYLNDSGISVVATRRTEIQMSPDITCSSSPWISYLFSLSVFLPLPCGFCGHLSKNSSHSCSCFKLCFGITSADLLLIL